MANDSFAQLSGKKIFITGGSRGIGAAIVKKCADLGATVAFTYSSQQSAAENVLKSLKGSGHTIHQLNIANAENVDSVFEDVIKIHGQIDGVVNNAGITKDQLLLRMKNEDFQAVIDANLNGTFYVTKNFAKHMLKNRKGSFVNISSVIGSTGNAGQSNYAASKSGIEGFTRSVALELSSRNIRANVIAPGYILSDMTNALSPEQLKQFSDKIPLGRPGDAEDIANGTAFLLSDAASYITGQTLHINGGLYLS
jgi:3-oxoacyl-[acyl-carrier protein] reductase